MISTKFQEESVTFRIELILINFQAKIREFRLHNEFQLNWIFMHRTLRFNLHR